VTTFNVLAPCYKRTHGALESRNPEVWKKRHSEGCLRIVLEQEPDIVCFQEFWFDRTFRELYDAKLRKAGYEFNYIQFILSKTFY
jgi:mRNA deadenylase 3'-5' endonuclease subunit Ccr4